MANTVNATDMWFAEVLFPERGRNAVQIRSTTNFFRLLMGLKKGPTLVALEYWSTVKTIIPHHFLCATIKLPGGAFQLYMSRWQIG